VIIGLIGAGNMATALARGLGEPVLCADPVTERAEALAAETGGEALAGNAEVADRADIVILCHKPAQLEEVAGEVDGRARAVVSLLASTPLAKVRSAYPDPPLFRVMPNIAAELRMGTICWAPPDGADDELAGQVRDLLGRAGRVVDVDEKLMDVATGIVGVAPAYVALVAEAWVDSAIRRGMAAPTASELVLQSLAGAAALLDHAGGDTLAVRRAVMSPGGVTAKGLAALERGGVRAAFSEAMDAVVSEARA
jgi:pyrroline-5-carboxylate reductase